MILSRSKNPFLIESCPSIPTQAFLLPKRRADPSGTNVAEILEDYFSHMDVKQQTAVMPVFGLAVAIDVVL